ncbi:MAG TPA: fasciclin domain-containing protein, partial [Dermatophilaceae bacterium]
MKKRILAAGATAALASSLAAPAAMASTHPAQPTGTRSLAAVLTADGNQFDSNWYDYDIVTEAVLAVLKAKPSSAVGVLADGNTRVTAFIPNDRAFRMLAHDLTGRWLYSEKATFNTLAKAVGINALEKVLLYHVVPGATIDSAMALKADGAKLNTALPGTTFTVDVISKRHKLIML